MKASHDATALRAPVVQGNGNGAALAKPRPREVPLATAEQLRERFAVEDERYAALREWIQSFLQDGVDYGRIPACGRKPVLFKPGAEKRARLDAAEEMDFDAGRIIERRVG